ncbi:MAG: nuclear transport factor 2 family protein [Chitinophagaceae bacterium]|nr:MAG: nuclear transport factor 2 family protein [Chitinophagaceae bacterium]
MKDSIQTQARTNVRENLRNYFETHDAKYLADDVVFRNVATGAVHEGKEAVMSLLHHLYREALDARLDVSNLVFQDNHAMIEGVIRGRHIGEYEGMAPTGKELEIPITAAYSLTGEGLIREARFYVLLDVARRQAGVPVAVKTTYLVRDCFQLRFGESRAAKELLQEALDKGIIERNASGRVLTDFTGEAYRLILERGFDSLERYEHTLSGNLGRPEWQAWYKRFKGLVEHSHREILRQVI